MSPFTKGGNQKRIVIAAGHYPAKPGCSYFGLVEHREATIVITHLGGMLREVGYDVREVFGTLREKIEMINPSSKLSGAPFETRVAELPVPHVVAAVEVHFNAGAGGHGTECLYGALAQDVELAQAIQKQLVKTLNLRDRGCKFADYHGTPEVDELAWCRNIKGPAVIIEPLFLSCREEADLLLFGQVHAEIAGAIFEGIEEFINSR